MFKAQPYDLVITDFYRTDDPQAGYTTLSRIHQINPQTPVIIYSASATPEFEKQAQARGAVSETSDPQTLFDRVITQLTKK